MCGLLCHEWLIQVAGPFLPQFEIYWKRLDPNDTGKVLPLDAAKFLKSSGLSDQTLGKVRTLFAWYRKLRCSRSVNTVWVQYRYTRVDLCVCVWYGTYSVYIRFFFSHFLPFPLHLIHIFPLDSLQLILAYFVVGYLRFYVILNEIV